MEAHTDTKNSLEDIKNLSIKIIAILENKDHSFDEEYILTDIKKFNELFLKLSYEETNKLVDFFYFYDVDNNNSLSILLNSIRLFDLKRRVYENKSSSLDVDIQQFMLDEHNNCENIYYGILSMGENSNCIILKKICNVQCKIYLDYKKRLATKIEAYLEDKAKDFHADESQRLLEIYRKNGNCDKLHEWLNYFEANNKLDTLKLTYYHCRFKINVFYNHLKEHANNNDKRIHFVVKQFTAMEQNNKEAIEFSKDVRKMYNDILQLQERCKFLELENDALRTELDYRPGGKGAKDHEVLFYSSGVLLEEQVNKK